MDSIKDSNALSDKAAMFHKGLCILLKEREQTKLVVSTLKDYIKQNLNK